MTYIRNGTPVTIQQSGGTAVLDAFITSGRVMGMGMAEANLRTGMTLITSINTIVEIIFSSGAPKRFPIPQGQINVSNGTSLRMNIITGELKLVDSTAVADNDITLVRVGLDDNNGTMAGQGSNTLLVVGGYFMKYFYPNGRESAQILTPKSITRRSVIPGGYQSMNFIGNNLWTFDKDSNTGSITIRNPDTFVPIKTLKQVGYHFNTTDYNPLNDALLTVYGWDAPNPQSFRILHGVSTWQDKPNFNTNVLSDVVMDEIDTTGLGEGPQAVWGESNNGQNNIVYFVTDACVRIRQLLLGMGSDNLGSGVFTAGKPTNRYNGSYKIIGDWTQIHGSGRIQDGFFYNGCFYTCNDSGADSWGQKGVLIHKHKLMTDGRIEKVKINIPSFAKDGSELELYSGGCTMKDGKIWALYDVGDTAQLNIFDVV